MRLRNIHDRGEMVEDNDEIQSVIDTKTSMEIDVEDKDYWIKDAMSMAILLVLYTLQGIPMGLSGSIPILMKEKGVSYEGLSLFSLVSMPFSLKLIWAPIVDSIFFKSIGRRKSWLVPVQFICGFVMIFATSSVNEWMGDITDGKSQGTGILDVQSLTFFFMFLYFLMATQDIAVDGWALTMLSRRNVGYASICNTIGQCFGIFVANQGLISLSDAKWCHTYLGMEAGTTLVTLAGFMRFWGVVFLVTTAILLIFKHETPIADGDEPEGLLATYRQVIAIFKSKSVQLVCVILMTRKIASAPVDAVSTFKMQEYGMPKSDIATIAPIVMIFQFVLPALMSSYAAVKPLTLFVYGCALQLPATALSWAVVQAVPAAYANGQEPSLLFFSVIIATNVLNQTTGIMVFLGMMSFFARISDPSIGGTYMTLLNTIANLGALWVSSCALWVMPKLSVSSCSERGTGLPLVLDNSTSSSICTAGTTALCKESNGVCVENRDSFTILVMSCLVIGFLWLILFARVTIKLQDRPNEDWWVTTANQRSKTVSETSRKAS